VKRRQSMSFWNNLYTRWNPVELRNGQRAINRQLGLVFIDSFEYRELTDRLEAINRVIHWKQVSK